MSRADDRADWSDKIDDDHSFDVTCGKCRTEYDNREMSCPACGSCDVSYSGEDAKRWNERPRVR